MNAEIVTISPFPEKNEWTVELKIPFEVPTMYTPLLGDRTLFLATAGIHFHEMIGAYQFTHHQSYIVLDVLEMSGSSRACGR